MSPEHADDIDVPMTPNETTILDDNTAEPVPNGAADDANEPDAKDAVPDIVMELDKTHLASGYNTS